MLMPNRRWLVQRVLAANTALVLLAFAANAWAEKERCVAGPDGEWRCGKNITDADAAPLPARSERSTPPVMLIDPRRFGEVDRVPSAPPPAPTRRSVSASKSAESTAVASGAAQNDPSPELEAPAAAPTKPPAEAVAQTPPTNAPSSDLDFSPPTTGFAVQLAVASSPRGFASLLAKLGDRPKNFQQRQLKNGNWVLLLGNFSSLEAARSAIPSAIPGAFARNLADLSFN